MTIFATTPKPRGTDILSVRPTGILPVDAMAVCHAQRQNRRGGTTLRRMDETSMPRSAAILARRQAGGLTLVELLVAVGILSMMILSFATIMNQSRKVVSGSQGIMRANTAAEAIMQSFRDSIRRMTQNGFLCIDTAADGTPQLMLTTAGIADSKTQSNSGTGSISCYGLCADSSVASQSVLWHQEWILRQGGAGGDMYPADLATIQSMARTALDLGIESLNGPPYYPTPLYSAPATLNDVNNTWKFLAANCSKLTISWTDGDPLAGSPFCQWYDMNNPKTAGWDARGVNFPSPPATPPVEYNVLGQNANPPRYRALWTKENQSNWPRAIRIRFSLKDPLMPPEFSGSNGMFYEVICPVAR